MRWWWGWDRSSKWDCPFVPVPFVRPLTESCAAPAKGFYNWFESRASDHRLSHQPVITSKHRNQKSHGFFAKKIVSIKLQSPCSPGRMVRGRVSWPTVESPAHPSATTAPRTKENTLGLQGLSSWTDLLIDIPFPATVPDPVGACVIG